MDDRKQRVLMAFINIHFVRLSLMSIFLGSAVSVGFTETITLDMAQAQCVQEFGKGATAEEELDFGEKSYVCDCAAPYKWNESNTRCVGGSGVTSNSPRKAVPSVKNTGELTAKEMNRRGFEANKNGNFKEAVYWYRRAADNGHAAALGNLARKYYLGRGVERNYYEAFRLFKKSAEKEVLESVSSVGWLYYTGKGTAKDFSKAFKWSRKAADKNHPYGTANLGILYEQGKGVPRDYAKALRWYKKSVEVGHPRAMRLLASLYDRGHGTRKDPNKAAALIIRSLKAKETSAVKQMTTYAHVWSKPFKRRLQELLRDEGAYSGRIDGSFGPGTKRAIRKLAGQL